MRKDKKLYDRILNDFGQLTELLRIQLATANMHLSNGDQATSEIFYEKSVNLLNQIQKQVNEFEEENLLLKEKM